MRIKKMLMFISLVIFTACINESELKLDKENIMMEEKSLDIKEMPLQTYEEYIKSDRFMLEPYIKRAKTMNTSGIAYLKDGSKITYYFDSESVQESITNKKYPFVIRDKTYFINSKGIQSKSQSLASLDIGKTIIYNKLGQINKIYDEDLELKKLGLNYKKVLEWADEVGIIDMKEAKILKGYSFEISFTAFKKFWNEDWGVNNEEFAKTNNLTKKEQEDFFNYKHYWILSVDYERYQENYLFSANGVFIKDLGKARKLDPGEVL